jgi:hypothetical protein
MTRVLNASPLRTLALCSLLRPLSQAELFDGLHCKPNAMVSRSELQDDLSQLLRCAEEESGCTPSPLADKPPPLFVSSAPVCSRMWTRMCHLALRAGMPLNLRSARRCGRR